MTCFKGFLEMSKPIAYSYVRFSSKIQFWGDSLRRQTEAARNYCDEHNLQLDTDLNLKDLGVSGFTGGNALNGNLSTFISALDKGIVKPGSFLLVESFDRLSRDKVSTALRNFLDILNKDVIVVTLADEKKFGKEIDTNELLISIMYMSSAHNESLQKQKRLKSTWEEKRKNINEKKLTSICPRWLKLNEERTAYVKIQARVKIVEDIYQLSINGMGKNRIAQNLNRQKIETWGVGKKKADGWRLSTIGKILANRSVLGEFMPHTAKRDTGKLVRTPQLDEPIKDYFPRIISDDTFNIAQVRIKSRKSKGGRSTQNLNGAGNLFTYIAKCGLCGKSMYKLDKGGGPIFVCDGARRGLCAYHPWDMVDFEKTFFSNVKELSLDSIFKDDDMHDQIRGYQDNIDVLTMQIKERNNKITNLIHTIEAGHTSELIIKRISELENERDEIELDKSENILLRDELKFPSTKFKQTNFSKMQTEVRKNIGSQSREKLKDYIRSMIKEVIIWAESKTYKVMLMNGKESRKFIGPPRALVESIQDKMLLKKEEDKRYIKEQYFKFNRNPTEKDFEIFYMENYETIDLAENLDD